MVTARRYLKAVGIGVTRPRLLEADDGRIYVVKFANNRLGPKVLVNEFIAKRFNDCVPLCFPPAEVIEITADFLERVPKLTRCGVQAGLHFASRYIKRARYLERYNFEFIVNKKQIAAVMLFDHLMHNYDRTLNHKNMIVTREPGGYRLYAIDNSHLFGSGRWQSDRLPLLAERIKLNRRRVYGTLLRHCFTPVDLRRYAAAFKDMTKAEWERIIDDVPRQWLVNDDDRTALKQYMNRRFCLIDEICDRLVASLPDINRRADANQGK